MMERLRAGTDSLVVKVILGLIILSFLFAGVGSYLIGGSEKPVAVVGEVEISQSQFEQAYQNERQRMQEQAGDIFNTMISDPSYLSQFRSNVLERMVNQTLLDQYAATLGLRVGDETVKNQIRTMASFLDNNGVFSNEQYLSILRRNGIVPEQFAEFVRQDLVREQLLNAVQNSEFALNNELENLYKLEEQSRTVRSLTLSLGKFADEVKPTQEEKQTYYKEHAAQFTRPEQLKISYISLSGANLAEKISVSEDEAKAYYQANLVRYGSSEQRKVSHIMIEGDSEKQKEQANTILKELQNGADFADLAKTRSQDTFSAEQGGQLDWFDKGVMDPAFEDAAFALKNKGDITTEVIQSDFGFHIIKLDDIKPSSTQTFAKVKDDILLQLKQERAAENFYNLSTTLAEKAFEMPDNLDEAAKAVNMKVNSTDFVAISDLTDVLGNPLVKQALQQDEVRDGLNSELIEISAEHVIVVRIDDTRPEVVLPFTEVEKEVTAKIQGEKGAEKMQKIAKNLVDELNQGKDTTLTSSGYEFTEAREIKRNDNNRDLVDLAFTMSLPEKKPVYSYTGTFSGDILLVALDAIIEPNIEGVDLNTLMADRVEQSFANANLLALIEQLKQKSKITNNLLAAEQP